jgi:hypothetical protein
VSFLPVQASPREQSFALAFRDLADGMRQQMYFWGQDVIHSTGNLFERRGFRNRTSAGLKGTSCYSLDWQNGVIELHGSHAGWFGLDAGFLFVRPLGRCLRWHDSMIPIPGQWSAEKFDSRADASLHALAIPFLDWWLDHEHMVERLAGPSYRQDCYRSFGKLPQTRPWLAPQDAIRWVTGLRHTPSTLPRAKNFRRSVRS